MKKRIIAGIATMAIASAVVPVGGAPSPARADEPVGLDASEVTGTVLADVEGQVEPVSGASVTVWWIPGVDTAPVGAELPIDTIAVTETRADGSYSLDLAANPEMQEAAHRNGGYLNFEVGVTDTDLGKIDTSTVTRQLDDEGDWALPEPLTDEVADVDTTASSALRAVTPRKTKTTRRGPQFVLSADSQDAPRVTPRKGPKGTKGARAAASLEESGIVYCSFIVDARPTREVDIIEFHNAGNSNAKWTYGWAADSDIDGAIDYKGDGGWKATGSIHVSNNRQANIYRSQSTVANNYGTTEFTFVDGHYQPTFGAGTTCEGSSIPVYTKSKRAVNWVGGVGSNRDAGSEFIGCDQSPQSDHRNNYPVGSGFSRKTSSAAKIAGAVNLGVITVGAQSGFSTELDVRWDSERGHGIWLCGTNYYPPTAGVIHAQNRP